MKIEEALRQVLVEQQPQTSIRRLSSAQLGPSKSIIVHYLNKIGLVNRGCREVPNVLILDQQQQQRVDTYTKLLENPTDSPFLRRIATGDEIW